MKAANVVTATVLLLATACSFLVESSPTQCSADGDCRGRGPTFGASVCASGRCVVVDGGVVEGGVGEECVTHKECTDKLRAPAICRARDHRCGALLSPECKTTFGDVTSEDVIIFGSIFSIAGVNGPAGIARQKSAQLAVNEIQVSVGGVRAGPGARPRPIALVECDDTLDSLAPARHLVDDVGVPAIVGVASSTRVTEVATKVTIAKGVLLISPTATSPTLTSLADANLVWRTAPSDALQALALIDQLPELEKAYRSDNALAADTKLRIAFVYLADAYGIGLYDTVTRGAALNGKPIADPSNAGLSSATTYQANPADLEAQVASTLAQTPRADIIVGFGSTEIITKFMKPLEARWAAVRRPVYLLADAARKPELLDLVTSDNGLRKRIRGSIPAAPRASTNFTSFVFKYEGPNGPAPSVFGMAGTYDSIFLLGYSAAAAGARPLTGDELQKGFGRLVSGSLIDVGGTNMNTGFAALQSPGHFDFDGASGPLDFDLATGEARSNIDVWCISLDGGGRPTFLPSGRLYDAKSSQMQGTYDAAACKGGPTD